MPEPAILNTETVAATKWLKLDRIKYRDQEGKERVWEVANRTTRKGDVDSAHILALVHHGDKPPAIILIEEYRPPAGATVVELPAGLVDAGEDAATTALRELHEETGYSEGASVRNVSPVLVKDPGMTGANMRLVTVDVRLPADAPAPEQQLEPGEHIKVRLVPLSTLSDTLKEYEKNGFAIDVLLATIAVGMGLRA